MTEVSLRQLDSEPQVFIVTPSMNQGRFLEATIESVLSQDYPNIDYFVADGGSSDESLDILERYARHGVRWYSGPDGGQAASIARAWAQTQAPIVAWLNSDDCYMPGAVTAAVNHLKEHPGEGMVYGEAWYMDEIGQKTELYDTYAPFCRDVLEAHCFICQPAAFVRREVFDTIKPVRKELRYCMDYDLWIRISEHFPVGYLSQPLALSRMYADNKTLGQRDGVFRELIEVTREHFGKTHPNWSVGYQIYRTEQLIEKRLKFVPTHWRQQLRNRLVGPMCEKMEPLQKKTAPNATENAA
ncbi:Chondroitin synthase [Planctomycetes bacterium Pan216]|uniref:Chondroitin synthase n=1 Tax=Kolteria novifilia TaxID=2527975 RepID=A0A518B6C5_9BACT|nr:Chondroitin synthase [Planctomycetes bacterium Pan216]